MLNHNKIALSILLISVLIAAVFVQYSNAGSIRDNLEDIGDSISDQIPEGGTCMLDSQCSAVEYCNLTKFHCELKDWFIGVVIGAALFVLVTVCISCLCFPCCCLYSMCRN